MPGERTSASSAVDEVYCVGCERVRLVGEREEGWVIVRGSSTSPRAGYCPGCMASLVRDASGKGGATDD
jgi:hypothetical protein